MAGPGPVKRGLSIPVSNELLQQLTEQGQTVHYEAVPRWRRLADWWGGWLCGARERLALRLAPWLDNYGEER